MQSRDTDNNDVMYKLLVDEQKELTRDLLLSSTKMAAMTKCENHPLEVFTHQLKQGIGRFQPTSRDTNNNREMYDFWWTNKRSK